MSSNCGRNFNPYAFPVPIQGAQGPQGLLGPIGPQGPVGPAATRAYGSLYGNNTSRNTVLFTPIEFDTAGLALDTTPDPFLNRITVLTAGVYEIRAELVISQVTEQNVILGIFLDGNTLAPPLTGSIIEQGNNDAAIGSTVGKTIFANLGISQFIQLIPTFVGNTGGSVVQTYRNANLTMRLL
ncbi:hypothetical protein [Bacillus cereus]|uniref:hypothetical protein n=1 Tax=Bacillus cereus TaxID=1396 RepID=UPI0039809B3C